MHDLACLRTNRKLTGWGMMQLQTDFWICPTYIAKHEIDIFKITMNNSLINFQKIKADIWIDRYNRSLTIFRI